MHRLFRSDRTGKIIAPIFLRLSFPPRWHYDLLKATEYFARRGGTPDPRLAEAIEREEQKLARPTPPTPRCAAPPPAPT